MAGRLTDIIGKITSVGIQPRAVSAGIGAALGAVLGPTAATLTGDPKSDRETTVRDMLAGAIGGAVGGLIGPGMMPASGAAGGVAGGLLAGLFDKKASQPGQDLRMPVMGGTKFPTSDSTQPASQKLNQSSAEVGAMPPSMSRGAKLDDVVAAPKPKWASTGDPMDPMMDDPLVLFLKKAADEPAKEPPPLTGLVEGDQLKDNIDSMPLGKEVHELSSLPPGATTRMHDKVESDTYSAVKELCYQRMLEL